MLDFAAGTQVYISPGVTDLRKSFNGLAAIVKLQFNLDPYSRCMFVFCNRSHNLIKKLELFRYRNKNNGYQVYHNLPENIVVSGCFCHARRKYDECLKSVPEKHRKGTVADEAIKRIALLYKIESLIKDKSAEERYEVRLKQSKPILDAYFQWLDSMSGAIDTRSMIGKAINYSLNQKQYLEHYLLDGNIAIDNSASLSSGLENPQFWAEAA